MGTVMAEPPHYIGSHRILCWAAALTIAVAVIAVLAVRDCGPHDSLQPSIHAALRRLRHYSYCGLHDHSRLHLRRNVLFFKFSSSVASSCDGSVDRVVSPKYCSSDFTPSRGLCSHGTYLRFRRSGKVYLCRERIRSTALWPNFAAAVPKPPVNWSSFSILSCGGWQARG